MIAIAAAAVAVAVAVINKKKAEPQLLPLALFKPPFVGAFEHCLCSAVRCAYPMYGSRHVSSLRELPYPFNSPMPPLNRTSRSMQHQADPQSSYVSRPGLLCNVVFDTDTSCACVIIRQRLAQACADDALVVSCCRAFIRIR